MHTPGHALINLAFIGSMLGHEGAVVLGAVLPDVPIFILYVRERLRGTPEETIWSVCYQHRAWLAIIHGAHSIPLTALGIGVAWLLGASTFLAFFASAFLHACCDLPVHAIDAHRHFLPLSQYRFQSPFSYWDVRFHARYVALFEAALVLACSLFLYETSPLRARFGLPFTLVLIAVNLGYLRNYWRHFLRTPQRM
jgi:hypothetical protein